MKPFDSNHLPNPRLLQTTLRSISEQIAMQVGGRGVSSPQWSDQQWRLARAVTVIHGVSGILCELSDWQGSAGWRDFILSQRDHIERRHRRLSALLDCIDAAARELGIGFVALKGAALHRLGLYQAGQRPMADIDLLVRAEDLESAGRLIAGLGYCEVARTQHERALVPVSQTAPKDWGEHADNGITVEVHAQISQTMPLTVVDITHRLLAANPAPGCNDYPSIAALMHHLVHHAVVNMQHRSLRLIQLHDIALLSRRMTSAQWHEFIEPSAGEPAPWWALPCLAIVNRYYLQVIPEVVMAALRERSTWRLRRRACDWCISDVSGSNLRIASFPGIDWAQSNAEVLRFLAQRLWRGVRVAGGRVQVQPSGVLHPFAPASHRRRLRDAILYRCRSDSLYAITAAMRDAD